MSRHPSLNPSVYLVTDTEQCGTLGVIETVRRAVAGGVSVVQLRDPNASLDELRSLGRKLVETLRPLGIPLIVNDHAELVEELGAAGAHVGQGDLDPARARQLIGPGRVLGLSVHSVDQVSAAVERGDPIDYLGVGPIWATGSKADAATPIGTQGLAEIVALSPWPCVAIGGITTDRAPAVRATGAAGVAVISAICGQSDVTAAASDLVRKWVGA